MTTTPDRDASHVTIQPATRADLLGVFRIEQASFPQPWPFTAFEGFLDTPGFLVAHHDGEVVGYVVADTVPNYGGQIGHVKDFAVSAAYRRHGIGRRLLDRAVAILEGSGVRRIRLEVRQSNDVAISLYRDFGFQQRHVLAGYYENGEHAIVMVRDTPLG